MALDSNEFQGLYSKKIGLQFPVKIGSVRFQINGRKVLLPSRVHWKDIKPIQDMQFDS